MRGMSIHDETVPLCRKVIRLGIETRGVSEIGVDRFYYGERNYVGNSGGTVCTQIIYYTGEELLKDGKGGRKQSMYVIRLRNAFAVVRRRREDVAVNNSDGVKGIGQDASSKEPG